MKSTALARCLHCGNLLPASHKGPCPNCGKEGKAVNLILEEPPIVVSDSWQSTREFYESNPLAKWAVILITILSPFIGLFLTGWIGFFVGFVLGVLSYLIGPRAVTKVREIRQG